MRRFLILLGMIAALLVVVPAIAFGAYFWTFYKPIPAAETTAPATAREARLQDIDYLARITEFDRSFSDAQAAALQRHLTQMRARADAMTDAEFAMAVAKAAAFTENGHTNARLRQLVGTLNSLPVRFFWFGDGLYVVRARAEHTALIGARVVSYGGAAPEALLGALDPYFGGNDAFTRYTSPAFFSSPMAMHAAGLIDDPDGARLTLRDLEGETLQFSLMAEERASAHAPIAELALPIALAAEDGADWAHLSADQLGDALYASRPETALWTRDLPQGGVYIRMRTIYGEDEQGRPLSAWLKDVAARLKARPAAYLALDLRSNGGGDLTQTMGFARRIADFVEPDGKVYILTDGGTFSAAIVTAAYARHDAGAQSVIVGETIGDFEQFWAESGGVMTLPNSGHQVSVATGYHDWENGCASLSRCYWLMVAVGVGAGPLDPDVNAPLLFSDYARGIDTGMEAVFAAEGVAN